MSNALKNPHVSEAEYLSAELTGQDKHEFVNGRVLRCLGRPFVTIKFR